MRSVAVALGLAWTAGLLAAPRRGPPGQVLGRPGMRHAGHVTDAEFSPSGSLLASCGGSSTVRLWSVPDGAPAASLDTEADWVLDLAWSPGGDALAVAGSDATVTVWDITAGTRLYRDRTHPGEVQRVAFLPDGTVLSGGRTGLVLRHDISGPAPRVLRAPEVPEKETGEGPDYSRAITDLVPTADGAYLVVGDASGILHLWDLARSKRVHRVEGIAPGRLARRPGIDQVFALRVSPGDGPAQEGRLEVLSVPELRTVHTLPGNGAGVVSATFTADGSTLLLGSYQRLQELPMAGGPGRVAVLPDFHPMRLATSADGTWLTLAGGPEVRLEHRATRTITVASDGHSQGLASLVSDRQGRLHSLGSHQQYKLWDLEIGRPILVQSELLRPFINRPNRNHQDPEVPLARAAPSSDGALLVFTQVGGLERRSDDLTFGNGAWDLYGGTCVTAAYGVDLAAAGDTRGQVHLLRPSRPAKGQRLLDGRHGDLVTAVSLAPDGSLGLSGSQDTRVRLLDVRGRRSLPLPAAHVGPIIDVEVGPGARLGASGGLDRTVVLWDLPGRKVLRTLGADDFDLSGWVAFSPDGDVLAASTTEGTVRLFQVPSGKPLVDLPAGSGEVGPVHFAPSRGELVAATVDGTIQRWSKATWGSALGAPPGPTKQP